LNRNTASKAIGCSELDQRPSPLSIDQGVLSIILKSRPKDQSRLPLPANRAEQGGQGHERTGVDVLKIQIHPFLEANII
jgi:hypothetical protein